LEVGCECKQTNLDMVVEALNFEDEILLWGVDCNNPTLTDKDLMLVKDFN
jgi:hypothetical protein